MFDGLLGLAFAAGLVAALNPCGFALLPGYLGLVIGDSNPARPTAVLRAVAVTVTMTLGFLTVFVAFGALAVPLASRIARYLPVVTVVIGVVLIGIGLWLLAGRSLALPMAASHSWAPSTRLGSMFGYGMAYAVVSLSCTVGPFLAVTTAAVRTGTAAGIVAIYLGYAAGFALIVGTVAVATAFAYATLAARLRAVLPVVNRLGGAVVLLMGLYVAYYGSYELRLFSGGDPDDPVITAAGRLQGAVAGWVHEHGGLPWFLVLVLLLLTASVVWARRR